MAFLTACQAHARTRNLALPEGTFDQDVWRDRYYAAYSAPLSDNSSTAVRNAYLARLRQRYMRMDLDILTPLTDQGEQPPVQLQEIFVSPDVRADPPAVELPRELLRRLAEVGELPSEQLPDSVTHDTLDRVRQAYQAQPARPVLEVLAGSKRRIVILGDPGSGKSTLGRYLALALAAGQSDMPLVGCLPLLVELRTYADPRWRERTFLDFIDHIHSTEGLGLPKKLLEQTLSRDGRVLVVFDGLDEIFDPRLRETITHQITAFADRYPKARIMVTSRVVGYRRQILDAAGFTHHMLQDFDHRQIRAFADRWYRISCPSDPSEATRLRDRLLTATSASPAIQELAGNPMLLTILAIIGRRRELPRDRRSVYEHAVTVLVEYWDVNKHLRDERITIDYIDAQDKLELLHLVARRMQNAPAGLAGNYIPSDDLIHEFNAYLRERYCLPPDRAKPAAKAMLAQLRERNFILSRFGSEVYGFVHRAFLEYLAASDIVARFDNREISEDQLLSQVFGQHWPDPAWHEVLLLVAGIKDRFTGKIIDFLLAADPRWRLRTDALPYHLLLALRCVGEARRLSALAPCGHAITNALIALLEAAQEREDRFDSTLIKTIERTVIPVVIALGPSWPGRDHYDRWYRTAAPTALTSQHKVHPSVLSVAARIGAVILADDPGFHMWMRERAVTGTDTGVRRAAVEAIAAGWAEDPGTLPWLRERATTDTDSQVRQTALQILSSRNANILTPP